MPAEPANVSSTVSIYLTVENPGVAPNLNNILQNLPYNFFLYLVNALQYNIYVQ